MKITMSAIEHCLARFFMLLSAVLVTSNVFAQVCSTDPITLSSQADVAGFQATYGPCDTVTADLTISGNDISDLSPLGITTVAVPAHLILQANPILANLDGLGLSSLYWLEINNNDTLTNIDALSTVVSASGPVFVQSNPVLTNINGLSGLSSIGGALWLQNNPSLSDLSGVSNVTSTGGSLVIWDNDALANLDSLANLVSVNGMIISDNGTLSDIGGLASLGSTSGAVYIRSNPSLASLQGLSGLTSVGGLVISSNASLTNLDALSGLTNVGNITSLAILSNIALTDISGLANVEGVGFNVEVTGNTALNDCSILERLLDDIDDFDPGPGPGTAGIPDVGEDVTIELNAEGCNSLEDIVGSIGYSVGGTVSGLTGNGLELQNSGADTLQITANGSFVFPAKLATGTPYEVTVSNQPAGQTCTVSNGSGTIADQNVSDVNVECVDDLEPLYTINGTVSGLGAHSVTLQNNGADDLIVTANGPFAFATALPDGSAYDVTVSAQPADQTCSVSNGSGTIQGDDVLGIDVTCEDNVAPPVTPPATTISVPTLSGWALVLLSLVLCLTVIVSRNRPI